MSTDKLFRVAINKSDFDKMDNESISEYNERNNFSNLLSY